MRFISFMLLWHLSSPVLADEADSRSFRELLGSLDSNFSLLKNSLIFERNLCHVGTQNVASTPLCEMGQVPVPSLERRQELFTEACGQINAEAGSVLAGQEIEMLKAISVNPLDFAYKTVAQTFKKVPNGQKREWQTQLSALTGDLPADVNEFLGGLRTYSNTPDPTTLGGLRYNTEGSMGHYFLVYKSLGTDPAARATACRLRVTATPRNDLCAILARAESANSDNEMSALYTPARLAAATEILDGLKPYYLRMIDNIPCLSDAQKIAYKKKITDTYVSPLPPKNGMSYATQNASCGTDSAGKSIIRLGPTYLLMARGKSKQILEATMAHELAHAMDGMHDNLWSQYSCQPANSSSPRLDSCLAERFKLNEYPPGNLQGMDAYVNRMGLNAETMPKVEESDPNIPPFGRYQEAYAMNYANVIMSIKSRCGTLGSPAVLARELCYNNSLSSVTTTPVDPYGTARTHPNDLDQVSFTMGFPEFRTALGCSANPARLDHGPACGYEAPATANCP